MIGDWTIKRVLSKTDKEEIYEVRNSKTREAGILRSYKDFPSMDRVPKIRQKMHRVESLFFVPILDVFENGTCLNIVRKKLPSCVSLQDFVAFCGKVSDQLASLFSAQILTGLEALHALSIPHGDISPENIFVDLHSGICLLSSPNPFVIVHERVDAEKDCEMDISKVGSLAEWLVKKEGSDASSLSADCSEFVQMCQMAAVSPVVSVTSTNLLRTNGFILRHAGPPEGINSIIPSLTKLNVSTMIDSVDPRIIDGSEEGLDAGVFDRVEIASKEAALLEAQTTAKSTEDRLASVVRHVKLLQDKSRSEGSSTDPRALAEMVYGTITLEKCSQFADKVGNVEMLVSPDHWKPVTLAIINNFVLLFRAGAREGKLLKVCVFDELTARRSFTKEERNNFTLCDAGKGTNVVEMVFRADNPADATSWASCVKRSVPWYEGSLMEAIRAEKKKEQEVKEEEPKTEPETPKKHIFGATVQELVDMEMSDKDDYVPALIDLLVEDLLHRGMEEEGIFRIPGGVKGVNAICEAMERHDAYSINFSKEKIFDLASAFKKLLREMSEPLISDEACDVVLKWTSISKERPLTEKECSDLMNELVATASKSGLHTLMRILELLYNVIKNSGKNKMSLDNLLICFAPSLKLKSGVTSILLNNFDLVTLAFSEAVNGKHSDKEPATESKPVVEEKKSE